MGTHVTQTAILGGGCFWCLEAVYQLVNGVEHVESGYAGGQTNTPDYRSVCSGRTGHAEVIKIDFDPSVVSYEQILDVFFGSHDPTTLNKQGNDVGSQYRSVIYYGNADQEHLAKSKIEALTKDKVFDDVIVTEVSPLTNYFSAEEYHQNYYVNNPYQGYCSFVVSPKVNKFKQTFAHLLRK